MLLAIYFLSLNVSNITRISLRAWLLLFPLLCIINVLFFQKANEFNSYARPLEAFILIFYCANFFYRSAGSEKSWVLSPHNWINSGLLLYFSGSFFIFILSNVVHAKLNHDQKMWIWNTHDTFVLFMYLFFAVGIRQCQVTRVRLYT